MRRFDRGVYQGLSSQEYRAADAVSKTGLDRLAQSPAHYRAYLAQEFRETPALVFGRLAHMAILEPERYAQAVAVIPDGVDKRGKDGKAWFAEQESAGLSVLSCSDADAIQRMQEAILAHPMAGDVLYSIPGSPELSLFWHDQATGERCKARPDWLRSDGIMVDLKTTDDAGPRGFSRSCAKYRYHVQDAFYCEGYLRATGNPCAGFLFLAVEKDPPYAVGLYTLDREAKEMGRYLYERDLMRLEECKISGKWPAYSPKIETLSLPKWAVKED